MKSTCDTAGSTATPPRGSDLDDEQIRTMLASPLYLQEREASADRSRVYKLLKRKLSVKFTSLSRECGETRSEEEYGETRCAVFKQKEVESRSTFRQLRFFSEHQQVLGNNETSIQIL